LDRPWGIPRVLASRGAQARALDRYCDALSRLYNAIRHASGAQLIVDSSKMASHALLLRRASGIELRVVHLVRDSRGVAYSVQKRVEKPINDGRFTLLPRHGPVSASVRYNVYNGLAAGLRTSGIPFMRLRYEDLVDDPTASIDRILAFAGHSPADLDFIDGRVASLRGNHMVDGNPVRFRTGQVELVRDEEWRDKLSPRDRNLVTALTLPLLAAYGYTDMGRRRVA
jgi:hypothetical protein